MRFLWSPRVSSEIAKTLPAMHWMLRLLTRLHALLAVSAAEYFPYGGCKARSCLGTPIAAVGPVAVADGF